MGIIAGNDLAVFIQRNNGFSLAGYDLNCSVNINVFTKNISSKASGKWVEKDTERLSWDLESEYLYSIEAMDSLFEMLVSRTPVIVAFSLLRKTIYGHSQNDKHRYSGKAFITDLQASANIASAGTLSIKLEGTGELKRFEATNKGVFEYIFDNTFE